MKKGKSKRRKWIEYIFFTVCVISLILFKVYFNNESEGILKNGLFTIGTVLVYSEDKPSIYAPRMVNQSGQSRSIRFEYFVNRRKYIHTYGGFVGTIPSEGVEFGQKYLVVYLEKYPQKSRMLFDYPILDSTDFKKSVQRYNKMKRQKFEE